MEEKEERVGSRRVKEGRLRKRSEKRNLLRRRRPRVKMRLFICKLLTHTKQQPDLSREKEKTRRRENSEREVSRRISNRVGGCKTAELWEREVENIWKEKAVPDRSEDRKRVAGRYCDRPEDDEGIIIFASSVSMVAERSGEGA